MAKKPSRRKFRKYLKGNIDEVLTLSTLGAGTLISDTFDNAVAEKTFVTSIDAIWELDAFAITSGDGPIEVGVAHSDYSDSEIQQVIDNTGSWDEGDLVSQEIAKRKVRVIGMFDTALGAVGGVQTVLNDGKPIHTKLNWMLQSGDTLRLWAVNKGGSPLATGANVKANGRAHLWPA
uniref:Uncharacterized protein n=1 Tax=uncultured marine virus TaxID=186617 RepID=A0A1J0KK80_9VIRU|nr:hypothetical protein [uncultured marine virus]